MYFSPMRQHRGGAGAIPRNQLITIKQVVQPENMTVYVEGKEHALPTSRQALAVVT
jgi:hypothetical protein